MRDSLRGLGLSLALLSAAPLSAQSIPLTLEIRGVAGLPNGDWAEEDDPGRGFGYGVSGNLHLLPVLSVYGGWERVNFGPGDEGDTALVDETSDTGYRFGLEARLPLGAVTSHLFGGGFYGETRSEIAQDGTTFILRSDSEFGYEAGAGIGIDVASFTVRPSVAYRVHDAEFEPFAGFPGDQATITYVVVGIGLSPRT